MPTVLTHPAVPVALAVALGRGAVPGPLLAAGAALSVLPDLDVVAFRLGVSYADGFGHRGMSHSLAFAALAAGAAACLFRRRPGFWKAFAFLIVAAASHPVLDAFTNGGLGVALWWPWSGERFFAPWRPIEVAPLAVSRFLSASGARVLLSEIAWVWLPLLAAAFALRRRKTPVATSPAATP